MPELNRRFFLQMTGAASLASALPAMPARAATTAPASAHTAKLLWASLYKRAGSAAAFQSKAQSLGLSASAAHGVSSKIAATHLVAARTAHAGTPKARINLRKWLLEDPDDDIDQNTDKDPET